MRQLCGLKLLYGFVVLEIVEVLETFARISVIVDAGWWDSARRLRRDPQGCVVQTQYEQHRLIRFHHDWVMRILPDIREPRKQLQRLQLPRMRHYAKIEPNFERPTLR